MQALEVLPLSHEAVERSGPALSQHLNPLHVHLKAERRKPDSLNTTSNTSLLL